MQEKLSHRAALQPTLQRGVCLHSTILGAGMAKRTRCPILHAPKTNCLFPALFSLMLVANLAPPTSPCPISPWGWLPTWRLIIIPHWGSFHWCWWPIWSPQLMPSIPVRDGCQSDALEIVPIGAGRPFSCSTLLFRLFPVGVSCQSGFFYFLLP